MLAWALSRWLGISLDERLRLTPGAVGVGVVAAVPLLLGLRWIVTTRLSPFRRLVSLVVEQLGPLLASRSATEVALLATLAGLAEEILFRGVVQPGLTSVLPSGVALVVTSVVFGLAHFVTPVYALLAGAAGLYLGALILLQGNLLVPIVAHAVYDFVALLYLVQRYRGRTDGPADRGTA
ncbi:MAG: CPBP family intramembrane metalloprotease [Gemmatimonadota bacterium]|nr:CPBP family intramembrane metalloprotease [Gemmatimonadota bacterium]